MFLIINLLLAAGTCSGVSILVLRSPIIYSAVVRVSRLTQFLMDVDC